jgi:hypothetical protein
LDFPQEKNTESERKASIKKRALLIIECLTDKKLKIIILVEKRIICIFDDIDSTIG